jgi:hypothetical protein
MFFKMLIGNTILGLARLIGLMRTTKENETQVSGKDHSAFLLHVTSHLKPQRKRTARIRLNDLENPTMPFIAWYMDNFIANATSVSNNNSEVQKANTTSNFVSRYAKQQETEIGLIK